jgi:tol-pal system protein YbgF
MAKKTLLTCTLLLGLAPQMTSCVTTQDHKNLQFKVRNQNNRIVEMEQQLNVLQEGGGEYTKALQKQQAEIATTMDNLKTQLLQIQGQIEEATHRNRALLEDNQSFQQQLDAKMASLEEQDKATKELLESTSSQVSSISYTLEQEAKRKEEEALRKAERAKQKAIEAQRARKKAQAELLASKNSSGVKTIAPRMKKNKNTNSKAVRPTATIKKPTVITPTTEVPTAAKSKAEKIYDKGLGEYRKGNYKGAIDSFTLFLEQNKSHKLLPNAKYWLGASRLNDGDYSGAVLEFQHIVADYPKHPKAPEALLKQAEAFGHFGDKMVQKKLYKDILSYYPKSEQAKIAKAKLRKL